MRVSISVTVLLCALLAVWNIQHGYYSDAAFDFALAMICVALLAKASRRFSKR